ncbi:hypothetical protein [putative frameshift], partial [Aspergillus niger]|uniref:Uncharacterized protein n=2 Tax=Aspergillus niger TaxID=5061 RepID=A2R184_ASPNC
MLPSDRLAFAAPSSYFSSLTQTYHFSLALWLAPWFNLCRTQEVISSEVKKPSSRPSSGLARLHHCRPVLGLMLV